jgi:hypothetical protein
MAATDPLLLPCIQPAVIHIHTQLLAGSRLLVLTAEQVTCLWQLILLIPVILVTILLCTLISPAAVTAPLAAS